MKTISNTLMALVFLTCAVSAQPPEVGFVRIVNAVAPGTGNATFLLDGRNLYADGYKLGQDTGGYGVKAGSIEIKVSKEGVETGNTRVQLGVGETMTVIAFAERLPAKDEEDPPRWEIKLLRLKQQEAERGYGLSFLSVCKDDETGVRVTIAGRKTAQSVFARRLAITKLEIGGRQVEVGVEMGDRKLTHISTDSPGNYVVILYETADGVVEAISFYDPKFVVAG
jgi:hypothetical protein